MTSDKPAPSQIHTKADPILLELWEIKRQINTEARFDIAQLARQANQFDIRQALKDLGTVH